MANTGGGGGETHKPPPKDTGKTPIYHGPRKPPGGGTGVPAPKNPYEAAQAHADAQAMAARRRESARYLAQAATVQKQIDALRIALGKDGLRKALMGEIANIRIAFNQSDQMLLKNYRENATELKGAEANNLRDATQKGFLNLANRGREMGDAMAEATTQGAGESDVLRAQGASLRNWQANQSDVTRSFYDTQQSINSSLTELTGSVRAARYSNAAQYNTDRNSLWMDYWKNKGDYQTQIGNLYGSQAEYYGLAQTNIESGTTKGKQTTASNKASEAWKAAARTTGYFWKNPGVSEDIRNWSGLPNFEAQLNSDQRGNTLTEIKTEKPEGATLRTWRP